MISDDWYCVVRAIGFFMFSKRSKEVAKIQGRKSRAHDRMDIADLVGQRLKWVGNIIENV